MKRINHNLKPLLLILLVIGLTIIGLFVDTQIYNEENNSIHHCVDPNHIYCDGGETTEKISDSLLIPIINDSLMCECDGLGCN